MAFLRKSRKDASALVSVVVPAWNEADRISSILEVLNQCPDLEEIIVVDDGSTDQTYEIVSEFADHNSKKIVPVKQIKNSGKTDAVRVGINQSKGELILLVDADLKGLSEENIRELIEPLKNDEYDMVILDRRSDRTSEIGWTNLPRLYGGERSFWKNEFNKISFKPGDGYLLETKLNLHYVKNKLRVKTVYCSNLSAAKQFHKHGWFGGLINYAKMYSKILLETGPLAVYKIAVKIEEDRLARLYKWNKKVKILGPLIMVCGMFLAVLTYFDTEAS